MKAVVQQTQPTPLTLRRKSSALFKASVQAIQAFWRLFSPLVGIKPHYFAIFLVAFAALLLSGCASQRIVDSQVNAFSKFDAAPSAGASWRFERLPSQQNLDVAAAGKHSKLEAMATQELAKVGFKPQPEASAAAAFTVQIGARVQRLERGPFDAYEPWGLGVPGRDYVVTGAGRVISTGLWMRVDQPWYVREVSLLIRDAQGNRVVYETQARHEGRWADDEAVLPAMFNAALQGFPKPPEGKRIVNVEIPR
jgi:hypothetical protein